MSGNYWKSALEKEQLLSEFGLSWPKTDLTDKKNVKWLIKHLPKLAANHPKLGFALTALKMIEKDLT